MVYWSRYSLYHSILSPQHQHQRHNHRALLQKETSNQTRFHTSIVWLRRCFLFICFYTYIYPVRNYISSLHLSFLISLMLIKLCVNWTTANIYTYTHTPLAPHVTRAPSCVQKVIETGCLSSFITHTHTHTFSSVITGTIVYRYRRCVWKSTTTPTNYENVVVLNVISHTLNNSCSLSQYTTHTHTHQ